MKKLFSVLVFLFMLFAFVACKDETYKVTFDSKGGTAVAAVEVKKDDLVPEPTAPTKDGFEFKGWYKDENYTSAWEFSEDKVTEDITLYAK